jgi:hypothetical protein
MSNPEVSKRSQFLMLTIPIFVIYLTIGGLLTWATSTRIGAECYDGTFSSATGSGACSHHEGVRHWKKEYWYSDMDEPYKSFFRITIGGS